MCPPYFSFLWAQVQDQPGTLLSRLEGIQAGQARLREGEAAIRREVLHLAAMRELVGMYIPWLLFCCIILKGCGQSLVLAWPFEDAGK
jgi:hypothetical protein